MVIVRCKEYRGCPLLGGSLSINAMLNSIRGIDFVRCTEVVRFSECPLWEVPLYMLNGFISDSLTACSISIFNAQTT